MSTTAPTTRRARTRTGCKTCRQRKLKCDEIKPVCGHCRKSNRECQPSEGVAFRHAQNAGFADQEGGNELGNFYKYRQKFNNTYFLPVPQEISFVHVTDPWADDASTMGSASVHNHLSQPQQHDIPDMSASEYHHPQYVDVAATSLKAMIDPNLEAETGVGGLHGGEHGGLGVGEMTQAEAETLDQTILKALKEESDAQMR